MTAAGKRQSLNKEDQEDDDVMKESDENEAKEK